MNMPIKIEITKGIDELYQQSKKFYDLRRDIREQIKKALVNFGARVINLSKEKYLLGPRPEKIHSTGLLKDKVDFVYSDSSNDQKLSVGVKGVIYARIHEFGGTTHPIVTKKSRGFFWHKFYETEDPKWKFMALTKKSKFNVVLKERSYLRKPFDKEFPRLLEDLNLVLRRAYSK